jgi:hypothetical protein
VHHIAHPAFVGRVPYTILLVELAEQTGLVMYGNLRPEGAVLSDLMPVHVTFEDGPDGFCLAQWAPGVAARQE